MIKFKERWEIKANWQFIFPFLGLASLIFSAYLISAAIIPLFNQEVIKDYKFMMMALLTIFFFIALNIIVLKLFGLLEKRWKVNYRWELIAIFMVFAVTGSAASYIGKPILAFFGITPDSLSSLLYWTIRILILFVMYQTLLVIVGWLFGQHKFFWDFEKKMLSRLGFKRFLND